MKWSLTYLFWFITFSFQVQGDNLSNLIEIACKRNPKLKICPNQINEESVPPLPPLLRSKSKNRASANLTLTRAEYFLLKQLAEQTKRVRNPFVEKDNVKLDQELIDFESSEAKSRKTNDDEENDRDPEETKSRISDRAPTTTFARVDKYCEKYQENYAYYCTDTTEITGRLKGHIDKFCPSYETNCPDKVVELPKKTSSNSFVASLATSSGTSPAIDERAVPVVANVHEVESPAQIAAEKNLEAWKKARPCTPDCDIRIWRHCTAECKCDYIYPQVQRFCNPPPIPFFLNTCRLWYYGCPKYQQYNYASQFIYSKAEKGKTLGGVSPGVASYGGATPTGFGAPGRITSPVIGSIGTPVTAIQGELTRPVNPEKAKELANRKTSPNDPFESTKAEFLREEGIHPKARQVAQSAVAGGLPETNFHNFDAFTNQQGVLYRARSRSPFSKPGLWEPNPDDPHNRDHANKWYYRPQSVGADWLSGQIQWGGHWAVPAAGVGGTDGFSAVHFPSIGSFLNIADDYD
uniref:Uncharacterized protein n=1 Tax=Panagrolaimus sp. JU765 TaxID=591449 RepID=A0AC34QJS8_9BILA